MAEDEMTEEEKKKKKKKEEEEKRVTRPATESTSKATAGPTKYEAETTGVATGEGQRLQARKNAQQVVGAQVLQEAKAKEGVYGGLGLADRARAERMVRSGEAKSRDEAAAKIMKEKKPKQSAEQQAGALER